MSAQPAAHAPGDAWTPLLGSLTAQRDAAARQLVCAGACLLLSALLLAGAAAGMIQAQRAAFLAAYLCAGQLFFYALVRSGFSLRFADAAMPMAQVSFGIGAIGIAYSLIEPARGASLVLLFLVLVFDMHRLTPRQIMLAASGAVTMLATALVLTWRFLPDEMDIRTEAPNIALACIIIPAVCIISLQTTATRKRLVNQKAELETAVGRLKHLAEHDGLTGLFNRRYAQTRMNESKCKGPPACDCCVAIVDIDHFKNINDRYGHGVGDAVLCAVSTLLSQSVRESDVLARWGGEEFLLFLPGLDANQSMSALQRLRRRASEYDWSGLAPQLKVSFSAGLAECSLKERWMQTLQRADDALYAAKRTGRDRIVLA